MSKSLPREIKEQRGTYQECRDAHKEELNTKNVTELKPPTFLKGKARTFHQELTKALANNNILNQLDEISITLVAEAFQSWHTAYEAIYKPYKDPETKKQVVPGYDYETVGRYGTQHKLSAHYTVLSDSSKRLFNMLKDFGLTPSARASIFKNVAQSDSEEKELLNWIKEKQNKQD